MPRISSSTAPMSSKLPSSRRIISSSSGLKGRPCRNSIGIALLLHLAAGGNACSPTSTGVGAMPASRPHEHRKPSTRLPPSANQRGHYEEFGDAVVWWISHDDVVVSAPVINIPLPPEH